jgi:hypothetical protein
MISSQKEMETNMKIAMTAVNAISFMNSVKSLEGFVSAGTNPKQSRVFGSRDNEAFKINKTLDANQFKVWKKEIGLDVLNISRAIYSFNASTKISNGMTVAEALREVARLNGEISKNVSEFSRNLSYMMIADDDLVEVDLTELREEVVVLIKEIFSLKQEIVKANNMPVEFEVTNELVCSLIK